jgi:UDP-galactopyranose mutase
MADVPAIIGGGRLFEFKYIDMDAVCASAIKKAKTLFEN